MSILEFIKGIDFFGKEPELYIQKDPNKSQFLVEFLLLFL